LKDLSYSRRAIDLNEHFVVIPSLGGLGDAHVLLCPTEHNRRMADAGRAKAAALRSAVSGARSILGELSEGSIVVFEHGASKLGAHIPCSVDHAHLHFVLLPHGVHVSLPEYRWHGVSSDLSRVCEYINDEEYLLWMDDVRGAMVAQRHRGSRFPSQVLRTAVAGALGVEGKWNWREYPEVHAVDRLFTKMLSLYDSPSRKY
jgi:hypothetical protein